MYCVLLDAVTVRGADTSDGGPMTPRSSSNAASWDIMIGVDRV
jgi:hypothetical protein